ncbi:iron-containing redox enzyme family protein [Nocardioides sp. GCM10027113]|uniref:iron-containing redox enzyme family protein n=1 Tax=unclassified Nocardioides TaxID=2615069 RepID=UPI003607D44E
MLLPKPRGAFSQSLFSSLRDRTGQAERDLPALDLPEPEHHDDAAIALWALHELAYRGFDDVDDALEWDPGVLAVRRRLEADLERRLRSRFDAYGGRATIPGRVGSDLAEALFAFVEAHDGASLARHVHREASEEQVLDLLRWRSVYHLKEADPTTWVVPRLPTAAKAALVELQYDEYGVGDPDRLHAELFARGLEACGLRSEYGGYVDEVPAELLEQNNALSMIGLHRRLRGAALGHLAAFEATSSLPSRRMAQGLERLGLAREMVDYYTEHVEADAVHEQLAVRAILVPLLEAEPHLLEDVFLGVFTCLDLEDRTARRVLDLWGVAA